MGKINLAKDNQVNYPGHIFKFTVAIVVANSIILYEEKRPVGLILRNSGFYVASLFSVVIAYLVMRYVFWVTRKLDHQFPWYRNHSKRLLLQFIFGVAVLILPLFIAAAIYFRAHQIHILDTVYITRYMPVIFLLLIVLSFYLHYFWEEKNRAKKTPKSMVSKVKELTLQIPDKEIAYLFMVNHRCFAVDFYGGKIAWNLTLELTLTHLPEHLFCRVSRSFLVNIKAIESVQVINPKVTKILLFAPIERPGFEINTKDLVKEVKVSARENPCLKKWYAKYKV